MPTGAALGEAEGLGVGAAVGSGVGLGVGAGVGVGVAAGSGLVEGPGAVAEADAVGAAAADDEGAAVSVGTGVGDGSINRRSSLERRMSKKPAPVRATVASAWPSATSSSRTCAAVTFGSANRMDQVVPPV